MGDVPIDHWRGYLDAFDELMASYKRRDSEAGRLARRRMLAILEQSPEYWAMIARDWAKKRPA